MNATTFKTTPYSEDLNTKMLKLKFLFHAPHLSGLWNDAQKVASSCEKLSNALPEGSLNLLETYWLQEFHYFYHQLEKTSPWLNLFHAGKQNSPHQMLKNYTLAINSTGWGISYTKLFGTAHTYSIWGVTICYQQAHSTLPNPVLHNWEETECKAKVRTTWQSLVKWLSGWNRGK